MIFPTIFLEDIIFSSWFFLQQKATLPVFVFIASFVLLSSANKTKEKKDEILWGETKQKIKFS